MRRKTFLALFLLVAAVAISYLFFSEANTGSVAGRPIGYWLDEMEAGGTRSNAAVAVFLKEGSAAVPALTNELRFVSSMRTNLIQLKAKLPWALASRLPRAPKINFLRRYAAAHALKQLGPAAEDAIPALLAAITRGDMEELTMTGPNGGMLVGRSWSHGLRAAAMDAMAKIDGDNQRMLSVAAQFAADFETLNTPAQASMAPLYESAMRALEAAPQPEDKTVGRVLDVLHAHEREVSYRALTAFTSRRAKNRGVGMPLNELHGETNTLAALSSPNVKDREAAAFELGDPEREGGFAGLNISGRAIAALIGALKDEEAKVRLNAAETLVTLERREMDAEVIGALSGLLDATNVLVRLRAVDGLRRMGPRAGPAIEKLRAAEKNGAGLVRVWATKAQEEVRLREQ